MEIWGYGCEDLGVWGNQECGGCLGGRLCEWGLLGGMYGVWDPERK